MKSLRAGIVFEAVNYDFNIYKFLINQTRGPKFPYTAHMSSCKFMKTCSAKAMKESTV